MIPANIDIRTVIRDLNELGLSDYKITLLCDFSNGYVLKVKRAEITRMSYQHTARLYNLLCEEIGAHNHNAVNHST